MGKGSSARPKSVSEREFAERYERTFKPQHDFDQPKPRISVDTRCADTCEEVPDAE